MTSFFIDLISRFLSDLIVKLITLFEKEGVPFPVRKLFQKVIQRNPVHLSKRLHRRYPKTNFYITDNEKEYHHLVAKRLLSAIDERLKEKKVSDKHEAVCRVGLVCGPLTYGIGQWIDKKRNKYVAHKSFNELVFVAMNKAAETRSFRFSANYLVTYFSEIFLGSKAYAYTLNSYDKVAININREKVDILLCSVGARSTNLSYIDEWLHQSNKKTIQSANFIGDFCLTPIDVNGNLLNQPEELINEINEHLDPYPRFKYIKDVKVKQAMKVILPVYTHGGKQKVDEIRPTGKELITTTLLRSQIVTDCIISKRLAKNLELSIGKYLIKRVSKASENGLCMGEVVSLEDNSEPPIAVHDPNNRLASCYLFDETLPIPPREVDIIPQIIISELAKEDANFDWEKNSGRFEYELDEKKFVFMVTPLARRPGQWALITGRVAAKYVDDLNINSRVPQTSILDLGCGCGAIGIFAGGLAGEKVKKIVFSDISIAAIDSTRENIQKNSRFLPKELETREGNMFEICEQNERFDIITSNPPFLPMAGIQSRSSVADSGGAEGKDTAIEYVNQVYDYLSDNGWAIIAIPDYVNRQTIEETLIQKFGSKNVRTEERIILYPYKPKPKVPVAYEIGHRAEIEASCHYNFEEVYLGKERYIVFKMIHYAAQRIGPSN